MLLTHEQINALLLLKDAIELDNHQHRATSGGESDLNGHHQALKALELSRLYDYIDPDSLVQSIGEAGQYYHTRATIILGAR